MFYATDQDAVFLSDGTTWFRVGVQPGDILWTAEASARTGYLICTGQAWPSTTGIYADLFAKWGGLYPTVLPDLQGRSFAAKGTHADMATIGNSDGLAAANRRTKHKHTVNEVAHAHATLYGNAGGTSTLGKPGSTDHGESNSYSSQSASTGLTVGPQTGAEPTDTSAYIVLQPQVKL
jgi:hypothetical protein